MQSNGRVGIFNVFAHVLLWKAKRKPRTSVAGRIPTRGIGQYQYGINPLSYSLAPV